MTTPGAPDPSSLSGRTVSHFRVLEPLGAGGMGVVYRAEDLRLNRTVALKFMLPGYATDAEATQRFLREARSVAALDHSNICTVHEVGESEDGQLFLAMSYYSGETLKDRLTRDGALPADQALDIAGQIARGLSCAHGAGIVHRDLKPANVMLTGNGTVKILDFGLAKARDQTMTVSGIVLGTVAYMAPEQLLGEPADARTDLWSLGVVLFEMLTGTHPTRGDDVAGTLERKVGTQQRGTVGPELTAAVRALVERLLRRDPDDRYQTADAVLADLAALRERLVATTTPPASVRSAARPPGVTRTWGALGGLAVLAALAGGFGLFRSRQATRERPNAVGVGVAVLPLRNYSGPDQEYFADGMTDELTSTLSKIEAMRVIAHQSVAQFKGSTRSIPEIARVLDVNYLVDGSIRQDEGHVRIKASLIDVSRNASVLDTSFDRDRRDVMELQREVALAIAQAIELRLTAQDRSRLAPSKAVDPEAFDLFIKGTQARYDANFTGDYAEAKRYLSAAIEKDSTYARPYTGLAYIHVFEGEQERARASTNRALALDPKLADAHMVLGLIHEFFDWKWVETERAYREALALNPGLGEAHHVLSEMLMRQRRFDEALSEAQRSLSFEPTSLRFLNAVGEIHAFSGRVDDALATANRILEKDSTFSGAYYIQGTAFERAGRLTDAETAWKKCLRVALGGCDDARGRLGYIYAATDRRVQARQVLDTLLTNFRDAKGPATTRASIAADIAVIHAGLGERAEALAWLERAVEFHVWTVYLGIDPLFGSLYREPRFQAVLKKIGLDSASNASRARAQGR